VLAGCLGWLAVSGLGHGLSRQPLVLATFDGGAITPQDLLAYPPAPSVAEIPYWVEQRTIDAAEKRILHTIAEERGLLSDPTLRLRARANVAVELAFRQVGRNCQSSIWENVGAAGRQWIDVRRVILPVNGAKPAERGKARERLASAVEELRQGAEVSETVGRRVPAGQLVESRIYADSALDPVLFRTAQRLADGEISDVVRTRDGLEVVCRDSSGTDPAPRFQRTSKRLTRALRELRATVCPEALHRAELRIARGAVSTEASRPTEGKALSIAGEALDPSAVARLQEMDGADSEALPEDLALAFRLASGAVAPRTRERLDEAEIRRLAADAVLRAERMRLAGVMSPTRPEARDTGADRAASPPLGSAPEASPRDRAVLARLREERHFSLDRQAIRLYAASLRP
jgi:hypothetical protein